LQPHPGQARGGQRQRLVAQTRFGGLHGGRFDSGCLRRNRADQSADLAHGALHPPQAVQHVLDSACLFRARHGGAPLDTQYRALVIGYLAKPADIKLFAWSQCRIGGSGRRSGWDKQRQPQQGGGYRATLDSATRNDDGREF
jgi:hypothetical protein